MVFILHVRYMLSAIKTYTVKKILVPCDFSDTTESALKYAMALAQYLAADLVLLHVEMIPLVSPEMNITPYPFNDMKQDSLDALKNLADKIMITKSFSHKIEYLSEMGSTPAVVEEQVKKLKVDLVVMGISGQGSSFMKNMIGSASVDVAKHIAVPLIIVPPSAEYKKIQNIVYACNYDENLRNNKSLETVKQLTTTFDAKLIVVHFFPENHEMTVEESAVDYYIEKTLEHSKHRTLVINEKNAAQGLLNFISENSTDLVIIEPKKHSIFHRLFLESTTNEIAFKSPVPVLTIYND